MSTTVIRNMREDDLAEADRIFRLAFGTFLRLPDPTSFAGDADYVRGRHAAWPEAAFVAERDGEVVGSILSVRRGSFGFFGPLTIRPDLWEGGIAKQLVQATVDVYERWALRHSGLFTFSDSAKHVALYGKFGFWPHALMALMSCPATQTRPCSGCSLRFMRRRSVDLPEPDAPTRKTNSPFSISTETSSSAGRVWLA
jgi:predicted N-acetyltransferase YhbS